MKKLIIIGTIEEFEAFVNREDIEIIQVDVKGVEPSIIFQQSFVAVIYYKLLKQ